MTTSPNKMSDIEKVIDEWHGYIIGSNEGNVGLVDDIKRLIKQEREAYALEENKNGFFAACGVCGVENTEKAEEYYRMYRAKLREKVGKK